MKMTGGSSSTSSGSPVDASGGGPETGTTLLDASFDVTPPPAGLAGFAFVVNGAVQTPMNCPAEDWEFPLPQGQTDIYCGGARMPPCPGVNSALIVNTGDVPLAYTAQPLWNGDGYAPGVDFGDTGELAGVLSPGGQVDITAAYLGGIIAVLGSAAPFSNDPNKYVADEGTIPWPAGVAGSGGATQMNVAQIELVTSCNKPNPVW